MIRKHIFLELIEDYPVIGEYLRENIHIYYHSTIRHKIVSEKKRFLKRLRNDVGQSQVIGIMDLDNEGNFTANKIDKHEIM